MDKARARSVAVVDHLDDLVVRVLQARDESECDGNTLVVFPCDNGCSLPHHQNNDHGLVADRW